MSDFNSLVQYTVENISRPVKYIIYKLTEFIRVVDKFVFRQVPAGAASGYATIEQIEGNTVAWNNDTRNNITGTLVTKTGDIYTASGSTSAYNGVAQVGTSKPVAGHKYYLSVFVTQNTCGTRMFLNPNPSNMGANSLIVPIGGTGLYHTIVTISSAASQVYIWQTYSAFNGVFSFYAPLIVDLTLIFGAGNEPTTVADFEAWLAQNIGSASYYDYNAGELLSCKMSGMQTEDSSQQTLDTIALDVTTITGINTSTNVRETIFPNGMKQSDRAGTVKDTLDLLSDTATVKVTSLDMGSLSWSIGNYSGMSWFVAKVPTLELSDSRNNYLQPRYKEVTGVATNENKVICVAKYTETTSGIYIRDTGYTNAATFKAAMNGVMLNYVLATPITYTDLQDGNGNPLNPRYKVEQGGTEQVLPVNTSTPTTVAPTLTTTYTKDNN